MLMLTHTYLLQQMIGEFGLQKTDPDIYTYNITPDLLTIHPDVNANQTHSIQRFLVAPSDHQKTAYVMFHLLVDDLAHYGKISLNFEQGFDPHSEGYTYVKGRHLINSILDLHKIIDKDISYNEAAYRSHLIIEMIYDLYILSNIQKEHSIEVLENSIHFTLDHRLEDFCNDVFWLYGIDKQNTREVLKIAISYINQERIKRIMNIEGRIRLFTDKFGLRNNNTMFAEAIFNIFQNALDAIDNDDFLCSASQTIRKFGWLPAS